MRPKGEKKADARTPIAKIFININLVVLVDQGEERWPGSETTSDPVLFEIVLLHVI